MKHILIVLFILLSFASPVFAGNLLQQQDELKLLQTHFSKNKFPVSGNKVYLIREDYQGYLINMDSVYGRIVEMIEDIENSNMPNKSVNLNYLKLLLNKIDIIAKGRKTLDYNTKTNILRKIIIDDSDYVKLYPNVKTMLLKTNIIMFLN